MREVGSHRVIPLQAGGAQVDEVRVVDHLDVLKFVASRLADNRGGKGSMLCVQNQGVGDLDAVVGQPLLQTAVPVLQPQLAAADFGGKR